MRTRSVVSCCSNGILRPYAAAKLLALTLTLWCSSAQISAAQSHTSLEVATHPDPEGNLGAELLGGVLGIGAAAGLGIGVMWLGSHVGCRSSRHGECDLGWLVLGAASGGVAAITLMPAGVSVAGGLTDGRGAYWAALLGGIAGAAVGYFAVGLATGNFEAAVGGGLGVGLAGAIVGYRWSAPRESAVVALPIPTPDGVTLRVAGAF